MKKYALLVAALNLLSITHAQNAINLIFTAIEGADYAQLDSIKVMNRTQGGDTVLYYPDTVLSFFVTGINEHQEKESGFQLFQNYPNPIIYQSTITLQIPVSGNVNLTVTDILGRQVISLDRELSKGSHTFQFTPGNDEFYFLTARYNNTSRSIKMLCTPNGLDKKVSLEYVGSADDNSTLKLTPSLQSFYFNNGDELLYIGYYDTLQSGMLDSPEESDTYIFQFAYDIPCPGTPTVEYEGQTYNTVQIMSQCWLKENLNAGIMIQGSEEMSDNDTIEKYCYNNEPDSCLKYGGLYQWDEMMQYITQQGVQGICPPGWHLPTDEEWKLLEGAADSQYGIGNEIWNEAGYRGYDAGANLKTTSGWNSDGNGNDLFGFSGLPGGIRDVYGSLFFVIGSEGLWWSSTEKEVGAWNRSLHYDGPGVSRKEHDCYRDMGRSVRCIKDTYPSDNFTELSFTAVDNETYIQLDSIRVINRTHEVEKVLIYPDTTLTLEFDLENYHTGDLLLIVGYYDTLESGILHTPVNDTSYEFQFAYNIPCPSTPTVEYEGQVYNTVQIMSQCWLKENLNVGMMIQGTEGMSDNDTIEKYCYNNEPDSCSKYGGLYQWDEMMQYTTQQGDQGICPLGWHLPSDEEWEVLLGAVDSKYGIGDPTWNRDIYGHDAGYHLKTTSGWYQYGNGSDMFGFSGLPGGYYLGPFQEVGREGHWWTSTEWLGYPNYAAYQRGFLYDDGAVQWIFLEKYTGNSVRCIKD